MRHVCSFLLSLILAPAVWVLAGFGLVAYGRAGTRPDGELSPERLAGLAALLVAGVIVAVLTVARLSPIGPTLAGLAYLGAAGWIASYPVLVQERVRELALPFGAELTRPAEGYAVLLGVPLVATAFSPRRWRRFPFSPALYAPPVSPAAPMDPATRMNSATQRSPASNADTADLTADLLPLRAPYSATGGPSRCAAPGWCPRRSG